MSRGVDVLAVMDGAAVYLSTSGWTPSPSMEAEFAEARAAVAELIEAVSAERAVGHWEYARLAEARKRTETALARVRGAA